MSSVAASPYIFITCQGFCCLFWELPPNLNWEILSTKYESEMNLGNNKQK